MEFINVFTKVGMVLRNYDAIKALEAEYIAKGYPQRKAHFAALGCLGGRSRGTTAKWYRNNEKVYFQRLA